MECDGLPSLFKRRMESFGTKLKDSFGCAGHIEKRWQATALQSGQQSGSNNTSYNFQTTATYNGIDWNETNDSYNPAGKWQTTSSGSGHVGTQFWLSGVIPYAKRVAEILREAKPKGRDAVIAALKRIAEIIGKGKEL